MTTKYYVVFVGKKPGVYDSWEDCKAQTDGFSGARFKSFKTVFDACNAWTEHVTGSPIPERPELAPASTPSSHSEEERPGWKPDSEYPPETQEALKRVRNSH